MEGIVKPKFKVGDFIVARAIYGTVLISGVFQVIEVGEESYLVDDEFYLKIDAQDSWRLATGIEVERKVRVDA